MSTPLFIQYLTDISFTIMSTKNKLDILRNELIKLNQKLPATVYIPFVNSICYIYPNI